MATLAEQLTLSQKNVLRFSAFIRRHKVGFVVGLLASALAYIGVIRDMCPPSLRWQTEICMDDIGCFSIEGVWSNRLINSLPRSNDEIGTKFLIYDQSGIFEVTDNSLEKYWDLEKPVMIVVHGWISCRGHPRIKALMDVVQANVNDSNILLVEWRRGAYELYHQAAANTRVVGAELARFLLHLHTNVDLNIMDVHLVGISLGSHIAGYAGSLLNGTIGRITALDSAGPLFEDHPPEMRLDPSDALFVDAIHTDGDHFANVVMAEGGLGLHHPIGHADFYPNGGFSQPHCSGIVMKTLSQILYINFTRLTDLVACDHELSLDYFGHALSGVEYMAYACENHENFITGNCTHRNIMGRGAFKPESPTCYYLHTTDTSPFLGHHYIVSISSNRKFSPASKLFLNLTGSDGEANQLEPGSHSFLSESDLFYDQVMLYSSEPIGEILTLSVMREEEAQTSQHIIIAGVTIRHHYTSLHWCGSQKLEPKQVIHIDISQHHC